MSSPVCRVLIADDDHDNADSLAALLRHLGHIVETAYAGAHAIEVAERFQPDVVFVDLAMPRMNGYEVAARIRKMRNGRAAMLVAHTGCVTPWEIEQCRTQGFDVFLSKPLEPKHLLTILSHACGATHINRPVSDA